MSVSDVSTKLVWKGGYRFTAANANGHETAIDGDSLSGPGPIEMVLDALGACSASDVVNILQQMRQPLAGLKVNLDARRSPEQPRYLTSITLSFDVWGENLSTYKLERAIALSLNKYCSVYHSIRTDVSLQAEFRINSSEPTTEGAYQTVVLS